MTDSATPAPEADRLRLVHELHLPLGDASEPYSGLVRVAAAQCAQPMAWMALQPAPKAVHLLAAVGLPAGSEWPAMLASAAPSHPASPLQVPDTRDDPQLAAWAASTGLRFYAACPVELAGERIGALVVAGPEPHRLSAPQLDGLRSLARIAETLLDGRLRERRLRLQNARLRTASLSSSDWLWETDEHGRLSWVSDGIEAHTGEAPSADLGATLDDLHRPAATAPPHMWEQFLARQARREPFKDVVTERLTPHGPLVTRLSGVPVFDSQGRFRGYRGATSDITAKLKAEGAARRAELLLSDALESLGAGVMISDPQDRVLRTNALWRASLRNAPEGANWSEVVRQMVMAGDYPDAVGREEEFITWRMGIISDRGEAHEIRWRDRWIMVSAKRLPHGHVVHLSVDITRRKRTELALQQQQAELRESQARLSAVLEAVPDLWFVLGADGRYIACGDDQHPMLVHDWDSVKGKAFATGVPASVAQLVLPAVTRALQSGEVQRVEYGLTTRDGVARSFEARISPMPGERVLYVTRDLTEQSRAADKLRLSEELYRSVAAAISDGLLVVAPSRSIIAVNPAGCAILGVEQQALVHGNEDWPFELRDENDAPLALADDPVHRVLATRQPLVGLVCRLLRPDGQTRWLELNAHPLLLRPDTHAFSVVLTFRDVTQERAAEQALQLAEERWNFALEGSGDGVWDWDARHNTMYFSPRWKQMIGFGDEEIGDSLEDWASRVHPDDLDGVMSELRRHLRGEAPVYQSEHRLRHRDGHDLWVLDRGKVVERDAQGRPLRLVGTRTDITLDRQAEQVLRDKQAAELASRAKSEFLSRMSHEMRTPLNAVIGFTQLIRLDPGQLDANKLSTYADHVLDAGQHLLALVNDVLDLQKVEEGGLTLDLQPVALDAAVARTLELLQPLAQEREVRFEVGLPADDNCVQADAQRLRQVLLNVVSNAVKYNRRGGSVRFSAMPVGRSRLALQIDDTGPGISTSQMSRLFQPFERLGYETSGVEGTGLGLIIARSLTQAIGGQLEVSSQAGQGTRVRIVLPRAAFPVTREVPVAELPTEEVALPAAGPRAALRMLYVEDNRINALLFEEALRPHAARIDLRVAEDGEEALQVAREWKPEVLVLDAHLPGMSGFDVLRELRLLPGLATAPAFMCSADAMPDDVQRAYEAGFIGYWTKPVDIKRVLAEVEALMTRTG
jgi:PAS domain S-box-containing protein